MRAAATVMLTAPNGELVIVRPGEEFPEWSEVTNPDAIVGGVAEAAPDEDKPVDEDESPDEDESADEGESPDEDKPADEGESAAKRAPAKRPARATKPAPTE